MPGITQILEIARRALASQQIGMNVTSHNISNANTPGYSRQRAELIATVPIRYTYGLLGTGVTVDSIQRIRNQFLDQQIRMANESYGNASAQQTIVSQIEANLNEPSDSGLAALMANFFNSFQDLSVHPEESGARNSVLQKGTALAQGFRRLNGSLKQLQSDIFSDVDAKVDQINSLTQQISDLNVQIVAAQAGGRDAGDQKDQRDYLVEQLSTLANINVTEDASGAANVSLGGIVIAAASGPMALKAELIGTTMRIATADTSTTVTTTGGELGGALKAYNTDIPAALASLDQIAGAIINRVNSLHSAGYGLGTPPSTGNNFFAGTTAGDMEVDAIISANVNNIAASGTGAPGDNSVALALSHVGADALLNGNTVSVTQFYGNFVSSIGSTVNASNNTMNAQDLVLSQLESQRESISGVSLDEEMTNLIKYQRSYDAAARIVNVANEMYQTILDMV
jgi:flagellar hook-associated protein 1